MKQEIDCISDTKYKMEGKNQKWTWEFFFFFFFFFEGKEGKLIFRKKELCQDLKWLSRNRKEKVVKMKKKYFQNEMKDILLAKFQSIGKKIATRKTTSRTTEKRTVSKIMSRKNRWEQKGFFFFFPQVHLFPCRPLCPFRECSTRFLRCHLPAKTRKILP